MLIGYSLVKVVCGQCATASEYRTERHTHTHAWWDSHDGRQIEAATQDSRSSNHEVRSSCYWPIRFSPNVICLYHQATPFGGGMTRWRIGADSKNDSETVDRLLKSVLYLCCRIYTWFDGRYRNTKAFWFDGRWRNYRQVFLSLMWSLALMSVDLTPQYFTNLLFSSVWSSIIHPQ